MFKRFLLSAFLIACFLNGFAQFYPTQYRPGGLNWQQLKTQHFNIVFPAGEDSAAWRTAYILEAHYDSTQKLTGGSLDNFPIILNNYNDWSNGFVTSLHFRSEIDLNNFKGKSLSPKSGNWLETVAPHELVHAQHFNNLKGIGGTLSLFSPDLARSLHGAIPSGITEGLATYYESHNVAPDGGRGNLPFFTNQFNATFNSNDRWSMGQMSHFPERTRPFNRHYMGGYEFTRWLQENYGDSTSKDALDFYIDLPFLGYGIALKHATGKWPAQLYDEFEANTQAKIESSEKEYSNASKKLNIPFKGSFIRRPLWIDNQTILFWASFYNKRAGFYQYDMTSKNITLIEETNAVSDYIFDLSADKSKLLFSYYEASTFYDGAFSSRLAELDLENEKIIQKKNTDGLYAPIDMGNATWALEHLHDANRLIAVFGSERLVLSDLSPNRIIHVEPSTDNLEQLAVAINKRGTQALWLADTESLGKDLKGDPTIAFSNGSIYDPDWHPSGDRLLLTADINGSMNVYEYYIETEQLYQLTDTRYNSFEASYNEDGSKIVFVQQERNEYIPAVLDRKDFLNKPVEASLWKPSPPKRTFMQRPETGRNDTLDTSKWESDSYASGISWLKPRTFLPIIEKVPNSDAYELGLSFHSSNLLQDQSYSLDLSYVQDRFWYDLIYSNKTFFPGFRTEIYSRPSFLSLRAQGQNGPVPISFLTQRRGASLSFPTPFVLNNNIRFSSFFIEPEIKYSQFRLFELDHNGEAASNFSDRFSANFFSAFSYRLQQNIRDVQPNSGITLFSELEYVFSNEDITISTPQINGQLSFSEPYALRGGIITYLSPLRRWNQSLRIDLQATTQSNPLFDSQSLVSEGFSEPVYPLAKDVAALSTRYTIPLVYPDDGGLLLPFYLSNIYLVAFTNTVTRYDQPDIIEASRGIVGGGIRFQFRISNLSLDIGVGYGYEISRNNHNFFIGDF
ncbi:MAG: hypothetical protein U5J95_09650 [Balneolaceae bacterium]|nr:hypothetical protein [Balneolaceae bacterium]